MRRNTSSPANHFTIHNKNKNNKNKKNQRNKQPSRPRPQTQRAAPVARMRPIIMPERAPQLPRIAACSRHYGQALLNPFSLPPGQEVCFPGSMTQPSQKLRVRTFGEFSVGAQGTGGVAVWPFRMLAQDVYLSAGAYFPAVITTNATYSIVPDGDFSFANSGARGVSTTMQYYGGYSSPYTTAQYGLASGRAVRLVGCGLRVQYTGKVLDGAGTYITYRNPYPTAGIPDSRDSIQDLMAIASSAQERVTNEAVYACYQPVIESDTFFHTEPMQVTADALAVGASSSSVNRFGQGVFIKGATAGDKFSYEVIAYFEVIGSSIPVTSSHSDPTGAAAVAHAASHQRATTVPSVQPIIELAGNAIRAAAPALKRGAARWARRKVISVVGGMAGRLVPNQRLLM